jgi:hypothetical protein
MISSERRCVLRRSSHRYDRLRHLEYGITPWGTECLRSRVVHFGRTYSDVISGQVGFTFANLGAATDAGLDGWVHEKALQKVQKFPSRSYISTRTSFTETRGGPTKLSANLAIVDWNSALDRSTS